MSAVTWRALGVGGCVLVLLLASVGTASTRSAELTMVVTQYKNVNNVTVMRFAGTATGAGSGETVDVLAWDCWSPRGDFRLITQTQTREGGGYQATNPQQEPPGHYAPVHSGTTFRARWKGRLSNPYLWRLPAQVWAMKMAKRRAWKVHVNPLTAYVSMKGKVVELQRQVGGRWVRYQRAKLVERPSFDPALGAFNHEARFNVPRRGLRLRAVLPRSSAAPCFLKTITPPWSS